MCPHPEVDAEDLGPSNAVILVEAETVVDRRGGNSTDLPTGRKSRRKGTTHPGMRIKVANSRTV